MKLLTIANILNLGFRVGMAYAATPILGIEAVWYAIPVGWTINLAIEAARYRSGKWKAVKAI